ncbi:MAG: heavy metal translocating P-type ATPase [Chloroflexaceae bacterium]|nr:heavy metal translocating P-type ATPase [Chloroflexaceae bacterium]
MFTEWIDASKKTYRRRSHKPLGELLATDGQTSAPSPAPDTPDVLALIDATQRTYVSPVIDRVCRFAEQHLAGTPLDTTTRTAVQHLADFQEQQIDPWIDQTIDASTNLVRAYLLPLLPARVRRLKVENLPIVGDARQQYARLLAGADDTPDEPDPEAQALRRQLAVAVATFGLVNAGLFVAPPLLLLSIPGLLYTNAWFLAGGYHELVHERRFGLMSLASILTIAMLVTAKFWELAIWYVIFVPINMVIHKTRRQSSQRLVNLLGETPRFVWVVHNGTEMQLPFEQLQVGDIVVVGAGEMVPVDGTIQAGTASIDQHMLTGEAQPAEKSHGDAVYASTIVLAGRLHIQVEQAGATTVASRISAVLNQTAAYQTTTELLGVRMSDTLALPMVLLALATLPVLGTTAAIAVACCSIGVHVRFSGPLSVLNFLHIAAEHGILIKDGRALETLAKVDTVVFDKTGTLTHEQPHVGSITAYGGYAESTVLQLAAAAEQRQSHPIARAILDEAHTRQLVIPKRDEATYAPGYGLRVCLQDGQIVRVGSMRFMQVQHIALPDDVQLLQERGQQAGHTLVYVAVNDQLAGVVELHTTIRPEVAQVVADLHRRGVQLAIISGDHVQPTQHLADQLGIDHVFAEVLPQEKASLVAQLQREGRTVCFVGDGINDSIALKQAQVSVSLRGATTIATDTAQVVLMEQSLQQLPVLFDLARQMKHNMQQNMVLAMLPGTINIASVFLLHTGIIFAVFLSSIGMVSSMSNAMRPLLHHMVQTVPSLPAPDEPEHQSAANG